MAAPKCHVGNQTRILSRCTPILSIRVRLGASLCISEPHGPQLTSRARHRFSVYKLRTLKPEIVSMDGRYQVGCSRDGHTATHASMREQVCLSE